MAISEGGDDLAPGFWFGGVAVETADLQRLLGATDEQTDDDLGIDAAFLASRSCQVVVLGLEVEGVVTS